MPALLALPILLIAAPALAHHAMDGTVPSSLLTGLLSGLGHPIIGLDHLAFLVGAGLLAAPRERGLLLPIGFIVGSLAGTGMHINNVDLPGGEIAVALSVVVLGALLAARRDIRDLSFLLLLALAGLFHGYAFGESIVGAQMGPLATYLLGLALIQYVLTAGTVLLWQKLAPSQPALVQRLAGAAVGLTGVAFLASNLAG